MTFDRTAANATWDAEVRPALERIADQIAPFVPSFHAAFDAVGKTDMSGADELAAIAAARKALNDAIEPHVAEIARLTGNSESNIWMMGAPKDEYDTWFTPAHGDPAEFVRNVARFRSFNTNFWTSQGWLGYGKGIDLPPPERLARERKELEAMGVDFALGYHSMPQPMRAILHRIGTERGYGPDDSSGNAAERYYRKLQWATTGSTEADHALPDEAPRREVQR